MKKLVFRYNEAPVFDDENIRWLDMNVPMMFRYYWYGTFGIISNDTVIDMDKVNKDWIKSQGNHSKFKEIRQMS